MKKGFVIATLIVVACVVMFWMTGCMDLTNTSTNNAQEYTQIPAEADLDGDGVLSPEEVAAWNAKMTAE